MTPVSQLRKEFIIEVTENFDYLLTETDVKKIADIADKVYTRASSDKVLGECTWNNHCLCEWCCPSRIENMFCICARNFDDTIEPCEHDTRQQTKEREP